MVMKKQHEYSVFFYQFQVPCSGLLVHLVSIFVWGDKYQINFILLHVYIQVSQHQLFMVLFCFVFSSGCISWHLYNIKLYSYTLMFVSCIVFHSSPWLFYYYCYMMYAEIWDGKCSSIVLCLQNHIGYPRSFVVLYEF